MKSRVDAPERKKVPAPVATAVLKKSRSNGIASAASAEEGAVNLHELLSALQAMRVLRQFWQAVASSIWCSLAPFQLGPSEIERWKVRR